MCSFNLLIENMLHNLCLSENIIQCILFVLWLETVLPWLRQASIQNVLSGSQNRGFEGLQPALSSLNQLSGFTSVGWVPDPVVLQLAEQGT